MEDDRVRDKTAQEDIREEAASPVKSPKRRRRKWPWMVLGTLVGVPVIVMAAWIALTLNSTYSRGIRAGFIQKLSQKGWVCKTWEGDLAMATVPGTAPERFIFTVRDDSVANQINRLMGSKVALTYEQHRGVPTSCFGDTEYFVTAARAVP